MFVAAAVTLLSVSTASASVLFDYITGNSFSVGQYLPSQSITADTAAGSTWAAEDLYVNPSVFPQGVTLDRIEWVGRWQTGHTYNVEFFVLPYNAGVFGAAQSWNTTLDPATQVLGDLWTSGGLSLSHFGMDLPAVQFRLNAGSEYFVGVRFSGPEGSFGLSTVVPPVHDPNSPLSGGFKGANFGFPNWVLTSAMGFGSSYDEFAVKLTPEPASVLLVLVGAAALLRRR
jgi:hypothetical protein